ncbi:MAG: DUF2079 domain-containing protein [Actinomycetota bacterium]
MSDLPIQRRLERQLIRQEARLEAGAGDRWIPTLTTLLLAFVFVRSGLARIRSLDTGLDLAAYSQSLWLISEGKLPQASLLGTGVHLLELNWSFIMYPLAAVATVAPAPELLAVVQGVALAVAVLPLWWLARSVAQLRVGSSTALIAAYALHPATHRLGTDDFHPESLAVPAILAMAYFGATKRWLPYWLAIAFALATRADIGLAVALWGFVVLGNRERVMGFWTVGVGLVWSLGLLMVVEPLVGITGLVDGSFSADGAFIDNLVLGPLRDPVQLVQDLVAKDNIDLVVGLLAPLIFLPLLSLRYLAPAFPLGALYLVADPEVASAFAERSAILLAFMMIAAAYALNRLGNMGVDRVFLDARVLSTLTAASVLLFVAESPVSPYERPWNWGERTAIDESILVAVDKIDDDVAVRASPSSLTALSARDWIFTLDPDRPPTAAQAGFPDFTRAVLVIEGEIPDWSEGGRDDFDQSMLAQGFQIIHDDEGVVLYSRQDDEVAGDG